MDENTYLKACDTEADATIPPRCNLSWKQFVSFSSYSHKFLSSLCLSFSMYFKKCSYAKMAYVAFLLDKKVEMTKQQLGWKMEK